MSKTFRPYEPEQMLLMPVSLRDRLPEDHLSCFLSDVVDHLDLAAIISSPDDGQGSFVCLLHRCALITQDS
jgi:hypothetical protein